MQKQVLTAVSAVLLLWAGVTLAMVFNQWMTAADRQEIAQKQAAANASEQRIAAYRGAIGELASDLDARQMQLEEWQKSYFGHDADVAAAAVKADSKNDDGLSKKISALGDSSTTPNLPPEARKLVHLAHRQDILSARLLAAVQSRAQNAEMAVRKLGLNPDALVRQASTARGGPFIPFRSNLGKVRSLGGSLSVLERALFRMEVLERSLIALPSGKPAPVMMLSSSYGYRSDPFTGAAAMHSGLDFPGPMGTPISSAAPGRVTFVGVKSGYGNVIEVDHGQSIMTRYAHLSGFTTTVGAQVAAGDQIGKMGSTGRSTGSHLHFEVRVNGAAVNPRRFLDAKADVMEAKADARQRVGDVAGRII